MIAKNLPFDDAEYARRLAGTRAAMDATGIDLLFVTDPSNMAWLTGCDGWSFHVHQGVIVPLDGDPLWWGRGQDANGARRTVWMGDECVFGYGDDLVQSPVGHPMTDLATRLGDLGHGSARIGIEMDNYYPYPCGRRMKPDCGRA